MRYTGEVKISLSFSLSLFHLPTETNITKVLCRCFIIITLFQSTSLIAAASSNYKANYLFCLCNSSFTCIANNHHK
ncbi:hypothetical protein L2E82_29637 [Cichorium intybus]|uniref:Uncharacterized protein n=1 Tax=Cichorium intybus TaxID=13427 RepID=A0ACB9CY15_CICIN|nr:hypothetical protein L2E82_29637 [Cichorium intybus]